MLVEWGHANIFLNVMELHKMVVGGGTTARVCNYSEFHDSKGTKADGPNNLGSICFLRLMSNKTFVFCVHCVEVGLLGCQLVVVQG